jgi:methylthioribose-1-phosphate isomerase
MIGSPALAGAAAARSASDAAKAAATRDTTRQRRASLGTGRALRGYTLPTMSVATQPHPALRWDGRRLAILDQTLLPAREAWLELDGADDTALAIRRLAVRGAPLIGVAAAYGLAMEVARQPGLGPLERGWEVLREARPTAVNLAYAVDRVRAAALAAGPTTMAAAARAEAERIHAEEDAASDAIAVHGAALLAGARRIATHCNAGALAAGGHGTALAVILALHERGGLHVLAGETRPLLQGARLTTWELARAGVPHELVVDGAMAGLIQRGEVDAVIVGCDRVAANGDTANKVGTYPLALAARAAGIPFVVAGPTSTIDAAVADGEGIAIEERDAEEVLSFAGATSAPPGTPVRNPAFDVTPASLVSALVTERGVAQPPDPPSIAALLAAS